MARFTPEGHLVVSSKGDGPIELVLPAGRQVAVLSIGDPRGLVITGERLYAWADASSGQPLVTMWTRDGKRRLDEIAIGGPILDVAVTPRGEVVALLGDRVLIHDAKGKLRHELQGARAAMALTADGRQLIASTADGVEVLDVGAGQLLRRIDADRTGPRWRSIRAAGRWPPRPRTASRCGASRAASGRRAWARRARRARWRSTPRAGGSRWARRRAR